MKNTRILLRCFFGVLLISTTASAVIPESGMYWQENEPGRGYYIEQQRGKVGFVAYAFEGGLPTFFVGSGPLQLGIGEVLGTGYPSFSSVGYEPWHLASFDIFRSAGGPCLTCPATPVTANRVGRATLFFSTVGWVHMVLEVDGAPTDDRQVRRFNFGYPPALLSSNPNSPPILPDLTGDWVFVDMSNPAVEARRFSFTEVEREPAVTGAPPWEIRFIDRARNAQFVCIAPTPSFSESRPHRACELRVDGVPILWAPFVDLGLHRIQAGQGRIRTLGEMYRGPGVIVGLRVE